MDQVDLADITFYAAEDADVVIELTEIFLEELKKQKHHLSLAQLA